VKRRAINLIEEKRATNKDGFDVAIVGAGYAGLSAALLFGRYLVRTVVFDSGVTRNSTTKHVHGYLGFENVMPSVLIKKAQKDIAKYKSIAIIKEKVSAVRKGEKYFTVHAGGRIFRAKYIVIATGVKDIKPDAINFKKFDGNGAWHCPHCDGLETMGKKLAIIVSGKEPISYAKEFLGWTRDITMFLHKCRLDEKEKKEAAALGIRLVNERVTQIEGRCGRLKKQLFCKSGRQYVADVIFYRLGCQVQSRLAEQLGCQLDERYVKVDDRQETTVPDVYAAGDLDTDRHYVVLAAAGGARVAISIYEKLLKQAIEAELKEHKSL
jgi:thioredoxin reductase